MECVDSPKTFYWVEKFSNTAAGCLFLEGDEKHRTLHLTSSGRDVNFSFCCHLDEPADSWRQFFAYPLFLAQCLFFCGHRFGMAVVVSAPIWVSKFCSETSGARAMPLAFQSQDSFAVDYDYDYLDGYWLSDGHFSGWAARDSQFSLRGSYY